MCEHHLGSAGPKRNRVRWFAGRRKGVRRSGLVGRPKRVWLVLGLTVVAVCLLAVAGRVLDWVQWRYDPPQIAQIEWSWQANVPCENKPTYKIDLVQRMSWVGYPNCDPSIAPKPPPDTPRLDGFWLIRQLSSAEVETFQREVRDVGLNRWQSRYDVSPLAYDAFLWEVDVTYVDGGSMYSSGTGKYPDTWDRLADLVWELTR